MQFNRAFEFSRTLSNGWRAFKQAPIPLFIGAFVLQMTESGGGGGGNISPEDFGGTDSSGGGSYDFDSFSLPEVDAGPLDGALAPLREWIGSEQSPLDALLGQALPPGLDSPEMYALIAVGLACIVALGLIFFALRCWIHPGMLMLSQSVLQEGTSDFGPLFSGGRHFVSMALWKFLSAIVTLGTLAVCCAPGGLLLIMGLQKEATSMMLAGGAAMFIMGFPAMFYVGLGLVMGNRIVALEGVGPLEALERSWELARGNRTGLFIYQLGLAVVMLVAVLVGLMMCCVGALVTVPVARAVIELAWTEAYLAWTRPESEVAGWWIYQVGQPIAGLPAPGRDLGAFD